MIKIVDNIHEANCITHNGTMHADEVFATAFLSFYLGDIKVFRTSSVSMDDVDSSCIVYDIGRGKFDHHQVDALKRDNNITYSSFGLLWKEFGKDFLKKESFHNVDELWLGIDKDLVEAIDGDDNGVFPKIECDYRVKTLSNIIKIFNPSIDSSESEDEQFLKAVEVAKSILEEEIFYMNGKIIAEKKVREYIDENDPDSKYLILEDFLPYEDAILANEKANHLLFVAYPSNRGGYAIKTIPKSLEDKTARMDFPAEWAGLEKEELMRVSGIPGLRFCHVGRFIVVCDSLESVYKVFEQLCQ